MLCKFIGKDGLGYCNGKIYDLHVVDGVTAVLDYGLDRQFRYCEAVIVEPILCPYDTKKALMANWLLFGVNDIDKIVGPNDLTDVQCIKLVKFIASII